MFQAVIGDDSIKTEVSEWHQSRIALHERWIGAKVEIKSHNLGLGRR